MKTKISSMLSLLGFVFTIGCTLGNPAAHDKRKGAEEHHEPNKDGTHKGHEEKHDERKHDEGKHDGEHDEGDARLTLKADMQKRIGLTTTKAVSRPLPIELQTTGEVDFNLDALAHVSPRLSGRVTAVKKTLGSDVKKGARLVFLDSIELGQAKADFLQAKAMEEVARLALKREEVLLKDQITSERVVLEARGRQLKAASQRDVTKERLRLFGLSDTAIEALKFGDPGASAVPVRAPISGRIVQKHVTQGELVTPEKSLFTIADLSSVWVWIDLFERDLPLVHVGDDVAVSAESVPGKTFVGKIAYIRDEVDRETRAVRARIDVANLDRKLKPGMYTSVRIADPHGSDGASAAESGLAVPVEAIIEEGESAFVFVQLSEEVFEKRPVRLGRKSAQYREVLDGLRAGAKVVSQGLFFLKSESKKNALGASGHSH